MKVAPLVALAFAVFVSCTCPLSGQQTGAGGTLVTIDGLKSRTPADWAPEQPNTRMRINQFRLTPINDDKDNAEVAVYFFGKGQGGSPDANVARWKGMFVPPAGRTIDDVTRVEKLKVGGIGAVYCDVRG